MKLQQVKRFIVDGIPVVSQYKVLDSGVIKNVVRLELPRGYDGERITEFREKNDEILKAIKADTYVQPVQIIEQ